MAQWNKNDAASNSVSWVARSLGAGSGKANQAANNTTIFDNVTADLVTVGQTISQIGVSNTEVVSTPGAHAGWVLKRVGSGGRAGRVTYETLVAGSFITGDADGTIVPDYTINLLTQPVNASSNSSAAQVANFSVGATTTPFGGTITYQWQANTGAGFANLTNGATYGNVTTANLAVIVTTGLNASQFKALLFATGAANVVSNAAVLTVTT